MLPTILSEFEEQGVSGYLQVICKTAWFLFQCNFVRCSDKMAIFTRKFCNSAHSLMIVDKCSPPNVHLQMLICKCPIFNLLHSVTCVVSSLHGAVMVAHRVQVVEVVLGVTAHPVRSSPWRPVRGETPAALAPLHHVRRHVHPHERELYHVLQLHPAISILNTHHFFKQC